MKTQRTTRRLTQRAFTLVELMIVMALLGIIAMLAGPSMTEIIGMQRLRAINDQLVTDIQFLRGEAVGRNQYMGFIARNEAAEPMSCYVIFSSIANPLTPAAIDATQCNCTNAVGSVCASPGTQRELRTAQIPRSFSIDLRFPPNQGGHIIANPISGGMDIRPPNSALFDDLEFCVEVRRSPRGRLRTSVNLAGRTSACSPDGSVPGVPVCPAYDATIRNCQAAI
jgi:prepilin-type N-terminal cleavage/methylation domain-containing protein